MQKEPVEFDVNGLKLRGNLYIPTAPKQLAVLFIHGWTGLPNDNAAAVLAKKGYQSMTFSLGGHNDSDGRLEDVTRQKSLNEVLVAFDLFINKLPEKTKIAAVGSSYGSYHSVLLSGQRDLAALSLRVPANYPDEEFNEPQINQSGDVAQNVMHWRRMKLEVSENRALADLHNFKGYVQVIEAEKDELVPHQTVQNYVDAVKDKDKLEYHLMEGWPHSLGLDKERNERYHSLLLNWIEKVAERL
jgi:esterase/lipase